MQIRIATPEDYECVRAMDATCFSSDAPLEIKTGDIIHLAVQRRPIAYAILTPVKDYREGYVSRAGTMPKYRGRGLQKQLTREQIRHAKRIGMSRLVTYTMFDNVVSANNYLACGFRLFQLDFFWHNKDCLRLELKL